MKHLLYSRRHFLSRSAQALGLSLISNFFTSKQVQAATWQKLQVGPAVSGVYTWGINDCGQLGINSAVACKRTPTQVCGLGSEVISIAVGYQHAVALLNNGRVMAWGSNQCGQLGDNTVISKCTPVMVCGISTAVAVNAWGRSSNALLSNGCLVAWGDNYYKDLADSTTICRSTPVMVCGISTATAIKGTYALLSNGTIKAWGFNASGDLGIGANSGYTGVFPPQQVCCISTAVALGLGAAVLADGRAMMWGLNGDGQLGDGTLTDSTTPVPVLGITNAVAIGRAPWSGFALLANGCIASWGYAWPTTILGDGTMTNTCAPVMVSGISTAVAISNTGYSATALLMDGTLKSWGDGGNGLLGNNSTSARSVPIAVCCLSSAFASVTTAKRSRRGVGPTVLAAGHMAENLFTAFLHRG